MNMKQMVFNLLSAIGTITLVAGCAGHAPNPIASHQIGDENRTITSLQLEISQNEALAIKKTKTAETKVWTNTFWFLVLAPLMDVKGSEKAEAEALRARNNYLRILISEKESNRTLTSRPSVR
ncbi:MAG: hypothetical protein K8R91_02070 [Phycisphaerae bacterium]|nr:hypothetical protein [Phycisphaerae bacterium]